MNAPPLPAGSERPGRRLLHTRRIELQGFLRDDGLFELEGRLTDLKTADAPTFDGGIRPAGEPLHGMGVRMVFDEELTIHAFEATMTDTPYGDCRAAAPNFGRLAGLKIQPGFLREAQRRVGGRDGCTHLRELLQQIATTAYQTVVGEQFRRRDPEPALAPGERPKQLDSCAGYRADGEAVRVRWPEFHRPGPRRPGS